VKNSLRKSLFVILAASLLAATCFAADDPGDPSIIPHFGKKKSDEAKDKKSPKQMVSSSVKASETPIPRVWIGLTGSYTPLKLLHASSTGLVNNTTGETLISTTAQGLAGGGLTVNARILKNYWLSIGAIYRFTGYDWTYGSNDANLDVFSERSRVRLIDFPVLVRYTGRRFNKSKYTFYELGPSFRDAISRKTTSNWTDFTGQSYGASPILSDTSYHRQTYGATAGAGIIAKDDFGIIVSPEVRYTRWMGDTFGSSTLGTQKNQLEITISFGF
jgi:hypothetical protein